MPKNVGEKYSIYGVNGDMTMSDFDEYCENRHWIRAHGTYYCNDGNSIYKNSGDGLYYNLDPRSYKIYPAIVLDPDDLSRYMYYSVKDMERIFTDAKIIEEENVLSIITDDGVFTAIRINDNTDEAVVYKIGLGELSRNKNIYGIRKDMSQNEKDVLLENNGLYDNGYGCFDGIGDSFDSEKIVICDRLTDDSPFVKQINLLDRGKSFKELRESWQY